jgi:hypothetical protein
MASQQHKNGTPRGGGNWSKLATPGDVQRYLRWLILQTKADKMDTRKASVMGQLGLYLLKTLEVSDLAAQVAEMEKRLDNEAAAVTDEVGSSHITH